jgi:hypothetical protein
MRYPKRYGVKGFALCLIDRDKENLGDDATVNVSYFSNSVAKTRETHNIIMIALADEKMLAAPGYLYPYIMHSGDFYVFSKKCSYEKYSIQKENTLKDEHYTRESK